MALDPSTRYAGQVATDAAYPRGKARNVSTEGDGSGTPLEADLVNDIFGLQQALLLAAGITPTNTPDTALSSQYLMAFYRLIRRVDGWGALGNDSADDTGALQAALTAVAGYGAGRQELHLVPGKIYRHTGLSIPVNVDIICHGATLSINHATNDALTYSGTVVNNPFPQKIVGAVFSAVIANTGATVRFAANGGFFIHDCHFGASSAAGGRFIYVTGTINLTVSKTLFQGRGDAPHIEFVGGNLRLDDCRHIIPATYSSDCVKVTATVAWLTRGLFELAAHNAGTMSCYLITSVSKVHLEDNEYFNNSDPADVYALQWGASAWIQETGSSYSGDVIPYVGGGVPLADGSHLSLTVTATEFLHTGTITVPDGVGSFSIKSDFTAPQITLPTAYCKGQKLGLSALNVSGTSWGNILFVGGAGTLQTVPGPASGFLYAYHFEAFDHDGSGALVWLMQGERSQID